MESFSPENPKFHETLREKRNALHLTQNELASALGISNVMVQRYETDSSKKNSARPSPATMKKIKDFFQKPQKIRIKDHYKILGLRTCLQNSKNVVFKFN